jgi:hypothetical protein
VILLFSGLLRLSLNDVPVGSTVFDVFALIGKGILSRENWGKQLGINRKTFRRWETFIISKCFITVEYWRDRKGKKGLDEYQRFVLLIIYFKKTIGVAQTNKQVIDYFSSKDEEGRSLVLSMKREQFYNYKEQENAN